MWTYQGGHFTTRWWDGRFLGPACVIVLAGCDVGFSGPSPVGMWDVVSIEGHLFPGRYDTTHTTLDIDPLGGFHVNYLAGLRLVLEETRFGVSSPNPATVLTRSIDTTFYAGGSFVGEEEDVFALRSGGTWAIDGNDLTFDFACGPSAPSPCTWVFFKARIHGDDMVAEASIHTLEANAFTLETVRLRRVPEGVCESCVAPDPPG